MWSYKKEEEGKTTPPLTFFRGVPLVEFHRKPPEKKTSKTAAPNTKTQVSMVETYPEPATIAIQRPNCFGTHQPSSHVDSIVGMHCISFHVGNVYQYYHYNGDCCCSI